MRHLICLLLLGVAFASSIVDGEKIISPQLQAVEQKLQKRISKIHELDVNEEDDDDDDDDVLNNEEEEDEEANEENEEEEDEETNDENEEETGVTKNEEEEEANDENEKEADATKNEEEDVVDDKAVNESDEDEEEFDVTDTESTASSNLCSDVTCKKGQECVVSKDEAQCRCATSCPPPVDEEEKVCGTNNITYASECELWRARCLYNRDNVKSSKHLRIDYFGPCIEIQPCSELEMGEYPSRMRSWLKNIYLQLYDKGAGEGSLSEEQRDNGRQLAANRKQLSTFEKQPIVGSGTEQPSYRHLYLYPAHWKFATLDLDPADKYLTKSELEPMLGTLIPLEHCTRDFFRAADKDNDHMISLYEWGVALGFKEEDMNFDLIV